MTVELHRWDEAPYVFVDGASSRAIDALDEALSYEVPDAEHTRAWKRGEWDGMERLLRESRNGNHYFPLGLLDHAKETLDALDIDYEVTGAEPPGMGDLDLAWDTDIELRTYQREAMLEALNRGNGTITMPTGAGKTIVGLRLMSLIQRPTMVTVHRQEIADQWADQIEDILGADVARCYAGDKETGDIQVALYQTIYQDGEVRDHLIGDHDVLIADEAHRVGADTFSQVTLAVNADYRYGFSATPEREDNATLKVIGGTGAMISDISPESLIEKGYLAEPEWRILDAPSAGGYYRTWQEEYKNEIVTNQRRNQLIANEVADLPKPCYVHVERINHGELLEAMIDDAEFIYGDSSDRDEKLEAFRDGEIPVLISTLLGEGVDVPAMQSMCMAGGLKTSTGAIQKVGRALRPDTGNAVIVDLMDNGEWVSEHSEERLRTYRRYYGEYGP